MSRTRRYGLAASLLVAATMCEVRGALGWSLQPSSRVDPLEAYVDRGFATASIWDDDRAEVSRYAGRETVGGVARDAEWITILRRESYRPGAWVAAGDSNSPGLVEVLKLDSSFSVQTGISMRHQMLSTVFTRNHLEPVRRVFTSQDWLGQAWKEVVQPGGAAAVLRYSSFWEGEGTGVRKLASDEGAVLLFDDLVMLLRALRPDAAASFTLAVVPTLVSSRVGSMASELATVETHRGDALRAAGKVWRARRSDVSRGERVDSFWFDEDGVGPLLRWRKADGTIWTLIDSTRVTPEKWNHPGDTLRSAAESERATSVIPPGPR